MVEMIKRPSLSTTGRPSRMDASGKETCLGETVTIKLQRWARWASRRSRRVAWEVDSEMASTAGVVVRAVRRESIGSVLGTGQMREIQRGRGGDVDVVDVGKVFVEMLLDFGAGLGGRGGDL